MDRIMILQAIQELPLEEQEALLNDLLDRLPLAKESPSTANIFRLAGIFSNGKTPPTDQEVDQLLQERRREKYEQS